MRSRSQRTEAAGALRNAAAAGQIPQLQQQGDSCCRDSPQACRAPLARPRGEERRSAGKRNDLKVSLANDHYCCYYRWGLWKRALRHR